MLRRCLIRRCTASVTTNTAAANISTPLISTTIMDGCAVGDLINRTTAKRLLGIYTEHTNHLHAQDSGLGGHLSSSGSSSQCILCSVSPHHKAHETPGLAVVSCETQDPAVNAMLMYLNETIQHATDAVNRYADLDGGLVRFIPIVLPATTTQEDLETLVAKLNTDPSVHGISLQRPLAPHLDTNSAVTQMCPCKDVDGLHPANVGLFHSRGCDPVHVSTSALAVHRMLRHYNIRVDGRDIAVMGTSNVAGRRVSELMLRQHASITNFGRCTPPEIIDDTIKRADVVVSACGLPHRFNGSSFKSGAVVIDFGVNAVPDDSGPAGSFKIVGDVRFEDTMGVVSHIATQGVSKNATVLENNTDSDSTNNMTVQQHQQAEEVGKKNKRSSSGKKKNHHSSTRAKKRRQNRVVVGDTQQEQVEAAAAASKLTIENGYNKCAIGTVMSAIVLENMMRAYEHCIAGRVGHDVYLSTSFVWDKRRQYLAEKERRERQAAAEAEAAGEMV